MDNIHDLDRQGIGRRIGQVRRKAGLTHIEFASKLNTLVMVSEIAEHGIRELTGRTAAPIDISMKELLELLKMISRVYNVPLEWLMHGNGTARELNAYAKPSPEEMTLFLPVTISGDSLVEEMNRTLSLVEKDEIRAAERNALHREYLHSILHKLYFYEQFAGSSELAETAKLARRRMRDAVAECRAGIVTE